VKVCGKNIIVNEIVGFGDPDIFSWLSRVF
jgi:hypothetical protein